jgi:hypothetical protein
MRRRRAPAGAKIVSRIHLLQSTGMNYDKKLLVPIPAKEEINMPNQNGNGVNLVF